MCLIFLKQADMFLLFFMKISRAINAGNSVRQMKSEILLAEKLFYSYFYK